MADYVKKLNKEFKESTTGITPEKEKKLSGIDKQARIADLKARGVVVQFPVNYCDPETGDVAFYDKDSTAFVFSGDDIRKVYSEYDNHYAYLLLNVTFRGTIKEISADGSSVTMNLDPAMGVDIANASGSANKGGKRAVDEKKMLENQLCKRVNNSKNVPSGEKRIVPVVRGTVTKVTADHIYVDILNMGLTGVVSRLFYRREYTRDLSAFVKEGQVLKAKVIRYDEVNGKKEFILSTADYVEDPWKTLAEKAEKGLIKKDGTVIVTCIEKPTGTNRSFFWGVCNAIPNLEVMCDYTMKFGKNSVQVGQSFKCRVVKIDCKNKNFKVAPYDRAAKQVDYIQTIE